ncbi:transposase [Brevibacterium aurantiacum]|uniref:Transposase DDE domain group 1 n=1 Tax=Brevibacterium aurantiacum TaxID=273384 RepID=A0A2H1KVA5_BREAU|nr:transposase [Brevibacterium aurantiacum]SMY03696.1 Transposase DDE domain group 1 [Brevibacterium aurantiacum]
MFTTIPADVLDTVQADKAHRRHAVIEQVNAELKAGPIAHMPAGAFNANAAWLALACMAHNLARTGALLAGGRLSKSRAPALRAKLISIPARIACHARRIVLHLPAHWPKAAEFGRLWNTVFSPPVPVAT